MTLFVHDDVCLFKTDIDTVSLFYTETDNVCLFYTDTDFFVCLTMTLTLILLV